MSRRIAASASVLAFAAVLSVGCSKTADPPPVTSANNASNGAASVKLDAAKCGQLAGAWATFVASAATSGGDALKSSESSINELKKGAPEAVKKNVETIEAGIKGKSMLDAAQYLASPDGSKATTAVTTWLSVECTKA